MSVRARQDELERNRQVVTTLMLHAREQHIRSSGVRGIAQGVTRASLVHCHGFFQRANAAHPEELPYPPRCLRPLSGLAMTFWRMHIQAPQSASNPQNTLPDSIF